MYLILVHWVADFVLQTREMGENKSKDNFWLTAHVTIYSLTTIVTWYLFFLLIKVPITMHSISLSFISIFIMHWITDYITSRMTSKFATNQKWYGFFTTIGFDQVLHYTQLFIVYTYIILNK